METLEIEDLKNIKASLDISIAVLEALFTESKSKDSLEKSRSIIEQLINDREFEQSQTTLNKL